MIGFDKFFIAFVLLGLMIKKLNYIITIPRGLVNFYFARLPLYIVRYQYTTGKWIKADRFLPTLEGSIGMPFIFTDAF